jgi:uncharacterized membrane protein YkvA (DUF1232 family)
MAHSKLMRVFSLLPFLPLASRGPLYGRLLLSLAADPRVPNSRKALLGLAAAYLLSPWDLVPERIPFVGALDDLAVIVLAVDVFLEGVPATLIDEKLSALGIARDELEKDLQRVRRVVPKPIRAAASRIPDALEGLASAISRSGLDRRVGAALATRLATPSTEEAPA